MNTARTAPAKGDPVVLETERFRLRSLRPGDASDRWLGWVRDPEIVHPSNAPVRHLSREQLAKAVAEFDNKTQYLIGVFVKANGAHIGFFWIDIDAHDCATFNVTIGEKDWWGKGVVNECRAVLLDYFFAQRGIAKACGGPFSRNFPAIFNFKAQGWIYEGALRAHFRSVVDGSRLDQLRFRLFPQEWRELRERSR